MGLDRSYINRIVNLTTPAPRIIVAILDDALPNYLMLFDVAVGPSALWKEQRRRIEEAAGKPRCTGKSCNVSYLKPSGLVSNATFLAHIDFKCNAGPQIIHNRREIERVFFGKTMRYSRPPLGHP
ncbi:hypothetical protein NTG1052_180025 [Candidatus Nitrotoga sp. 1052]|nr:hypothetical protein NTG1052_180025 [Candidatus Nitrotoga sp. 1052]